MRDGNKQSEITRLKREIIRKLYSNDDIIEILDCDEIDPECPDTAEGTAIFDFIKIPSTQESVGTFIGVKITAANPNEHNMIFMDYTVTLAILCSSTRMSVKGQKGNRVDILAADIIETLVWDETMGMMLRLQSNAEDNYNDHYYSRVIVFSTERGNHIPQRGGSLIAR